MTAARLFVGPLDLDASPAGTRIVRKLLQAPELIQIFTQSSPILAVISRSGGDCPEP